MARWSQSIPNVRASSYYFAEFCNTCFTVCLGIDEFKGFLAFVNAKVGLKESLAEQIRSEYRDMICHNADIESAIQRCPCELAYALALIDTTDYRSITPAWVLHNYPNVENLVRLLRHTKCSEGCPYCNKELDVHINLNRFFGFDKFRTYDGEPLQENAVRAAVEHKSLLAIFPTGGGKSLTFQLPALMEGRSVHGLTVVISPLQSLMKDQVDNLAERGITDAVTINGLLDPISRSEAIQRVMDGDASLLYISPEMLRSKTIEKILLARHLVRIVIDEAHCFSSWGQDFRVDYLYIGKFIDQYQKKKANGQAIPISCFTATAKQKVIQDICDYFKKTLNIDLQIFASSSARKNLRYSVIHVDTDDEKYTKLRSLIAESSCPAIVYVSRTKRTRQLAEKLTRDGFKALPFDGKMNVEEKIANQEAFMNDSVRIIVATSAFGMGVDKKDVGLVIHYDISDSLENYVQEAGRAGRDPHLEARCFVLYSDADLDKHFILLNQTKLSISEIQQVWKAVKDLTKLRMRVCCSALEIARQAGWDDSVSDIETRVRTALAALEQAGYLERGNNVPHVYATGITVKNMEEARQRITESLLFENEEVEKAIRIIKSLISQKYTVKTQDAEAESRIDYLADILGLSKGEVVSSVVRMRQEGILADSKDISAYLHDTGDSENKSKRLLERFSKLERYILGHVSSEVCRISYKQLNDNAQKEGIDTATEKDIRTLLFFLTVKGYTRKKEDGAHNIQLCSQADMGAAMRRFEKRLEICQFTIGWLYRLTARNVEADKGNSDVRFSVVELLNDLKTTGNTLMESRSDVSMEDVEEALLYLSKIGALKLEGGFLVLYNAMDIRRIKDNRSRYKQDDYRMLSEFYKQKIQQIHIVGEYANLMVRDYNAALRYVHDYFQMDYKRFRTSGLRIIIYMTAIQEELSLSCRSRCRATSVNGQKKDTAWSRHPSGLSYHGDLRMPRRKKKNMQYCL
ncbi:MAG: RecQ family ATP-dependent DNA helicase [Muribaculaceae bacterium]|nr:RecQ family ATP-dependent DNA helicase [Muribaculaceae bacterium]